MTATDRSGFSLMEVLLATGILLGSVIVLGELAAIGRQHANSAEDLATAQQLCRNRLSEMLAGLTSIEPVEAEPLEVIVEEVSVESDESVLAIEPDEEPEWLHSVEIEPMDDVGLVSVRVTVWRAEDDEEEEGPRKAFSLVRWMRDPFFDETEPAGARMLSRRSFP